MIERERKFLTEMKYHMMIVETLLMLRNVITVLGQLIIYLSTKLHDIKSGKTSVLEFAP
jgi:hypothetical protein